MAIESASISPQGAPQVVDTVAAGSKKANKGQAEALEPKANAKFVPEKVKVEIDRQPLVSANELESKIADLNKALVSRNQAVAFSTDARTGHEVVKVTNRSTGALIRQMPTLEVLQAMQNIDRMIGLIFNRKT